MGPLFFLISFINTLSFQLKMEIYQPAEDSYLLQQLVRKQVKKYAFGRVLDLGTGSGIQALTAIQDPNVREVIAVDINKNAVENLNTEIKEKKLRKIKAKVSNLFENVEGHFNLIIFNPPYLPQDKGIEDLALYGGKKGWEISELFFNQVSKYLFPDGKILFLFSNLSNKKKIEQIIKDNLLQFKELERQKLPLFEELYVYEVTKTELLRQLESKHLENITYLTHGRRGDIFTGIIDKSKLIKTHLAKQELIKVGIKIKRKESEAIERIRNEVNWLKIINKENIGPKLLFFGENFFVYQFVEGDFILDWINNHQKKEIQNVLIYLLKQCLVMDKLKVNKEEMHRPLKHIIIDKNNYPVFIDFERSHKTDKPHNVTQFVEFISRLSKELSKKGFTFKIESLRDLARSYKEDINENSLEIIINSIS